MCLKSKAMRLRENAKNAANLCNYMYSVDTYTEREFKIMQTIFPKYKRFYIKGKDEYGNLIFACKLVTPEGLCSDYKHRLRMCKNYPAKRVSYNAKLHDEFADTKSILKTLKVFLIKAFI